MTTVIQPDDLIQSIADALQFISYYHPVDYIQALGDAWEKEQAPAAKDAMAQILVNSRMAAESHRPICQDTGAVVVFLKVGMGVRFAGDRSVNDLINEGVRQAYTHPDNTLRASMVSPPVGNRRNTRDNTPAIIHTELVPGDTLEVAVAAKGGGSENKAKFTVLNPSDSVVDWVVNTVPTMGAGWCPPGMLGIGIGGTAEKALLLAKESLLAPIDMPQLLARGPRNELEALRIEIFNAVNALGIGAQGLGGLTTVVDVKIKDYPTHATSLPVGLIPNCAATRHIEFTLDGRGPAVLTPPRLEDWPKVTWQAGADARRVNLDTLTKDSVAQWRAGDRILRSGKLLTAHKRLRDLLHVGEPLPEGLDFTNRVIYYVGPVDPVGNEVVGPAGPTTATRMDPFSDMMLGDLGLIGMVGKAERGPAGVDAIRRHGAVYLMAVGGAAYLVSKAIKASRVVAFDDLGMEAIYEFEVNDMPVTVAVDSTGDAVHTTGPAHWREKIGRTTVA